MNQSLRPIAIGAALAAACAHAPKKDVVWPDPPDKARIKFVKTLSSESDLADTAWDSFRRAFVGGTSPKRMSHPLGLALSADGQRLYAVDEAAGAVWVLDFRAKTFERFGDALIPDPLGIALDAEGRVYVSSGGAGRVFVFDKDGNKVAAFGKDLVHPTGLAIDQKRQLLYVVDSGGGKSQHHCIEVLSLSGELLRTIGRRGQAPGEFNFPTFAVVDGDGKLFVTDTLNFRIQIFDPDGNFLQKFGEPGDVPGTFQRMKGIAFDGFGNLYVVDTGASAVQMFNSKFDLLMTFAGNAPFIEYLQLPIAIAVDPHTNLIYVSEGGKTPRINVYQLINTSADESTDRAKPGAASRPGMGESPQGAARPADKTP